MPIAETSPFRNRKLSDVLFMKEYSQTREPSKTVDSANSRRRMPDEFKITKSKSPSLLRWISTCPYQTISHWDLTHYANSISRALIRIVNMHISPRPRLLVPQSTSTMFAHLAPLAKTRSVSHAIHHPHKNLHIRWRQIASSGRIAPINDVLLFTLCFVGMVPIAQRQIASLVMSRLSAGSIHA